MLCSMDRGSFSRLPVVASVSWGTWMVRRMLPTVPVILVSGLFGGSVVAQSGFGPASPATGVQGAFSASGILRQAASAAATLNYTGTIVYQRRGAADTSRIVHLFENGVEMERITTLDGPPAEFVRVNEDLTCYLPQDRLMRIESRTGRQGFPSLHPRQMTTLGQFFNVKKLEVERVAGHDAQVWLFEPTDEFRFWQKLWTELKTGLWLRGRVLDEKGNTIEEITFTDIQIGGKIDREQVKPTFASKIAQWRVDRKSSLLATRADTGWQSKSLPAGFVKISETFMRSLPGRAQPVSQLVFSDGLTSVSVYAAALGQNETPSVGASVQGSHQIFTKHMGEHLITAFGDARPAAVKAIAAGVARRP